MPWELWRQDDHGNEFLVREFVDRGAAEEARDSFAARGHHQHYWVVERPGGVRVRAVEAGERGWLRQTLAARWGGVEVVGRGRSWRPGELPALLAVADDGERLGIATYDVDGAAAELVTLDALVPGRGAGRALIEAAAAAAREAGALRLVVMTTNDNLRARRLYQRAGFRLAALRPGAIDSARERKPSIPLTGNDGIAIRDELDLVMELREP
jgi:ribosomal protein S18 acetylase RimI-like enzyme